MLANLRNPPCRSRRGTASRGERRGFRWVREIRGRNAARSSKGPSASGVQRNRGNEVSPTKRLPRDRLGTNRGCSRRSAGGSGDSQGVWRPFGTRSFQPARGHPCGPAPPRTRPDPDAPTRARAFVPSSPTVNSARSGMCKPSREHSSRPAPPRTRSGPTASSDRPHRELGPAARPRLGDSVNSNGGIVPAQPSLRNERPEGATAQAGVVEPRPSEYNFATRGRGEVLWSNRGGLRAKGRGVERKTPMVSKLRLLKTGHGDLTLAEWDRNVPETVSSAEALFQEHLTPGRLAFRLDGPGRSRLIQRFDVAAPEILIVPAIRGGGTPRPSAAPEHRGCGPGSVPTTP